MGQVTTIGLDTAKSVFQVHGVDATGIRASRPELPRYSCSAVRRHDRERLI
jgi:transposase